MLSLEAKHAELWQSQHTQTHSQLNTPAYVSQNLSLIRTERTEENNKMDRSGGTAAESQSALAQMAIERLSWEKGKRIEVSAEEEGCSYLPVDYHSLSSFSMYFPGFYCSCPISLHIFPQRKNCSFRSSLYRISSEPFCTVDVCLLKSLYYLQNTVCTSCCHLVQRLRAVH